MSQVELELQEQPRPAQLGVMVPSNLELVFLGPSDSAVLMAGAQQLQPILSQRGVKGQWEEIIQPFI